MMRHFVLLKSAVTAALALAVLGASMKVEAQGRPNFKWMFGGNPSLNAYDLDLSPDGSLLAVDVSGVEIQVFRLSDGQLIKTIEADQSTETILASKFSPDGSTLYVEVGGPIVLRKYSVPSFTPAGSISMGSLLSGREIFFSSDGQFVAVSDGKVFRTADGSPVQFYKSGNPVSLNSVFGFVGHEVSVYYYPDYFSNFPRQVYDCDSGEFVRNGPPNDFSYEAVPDPTGQFASGRDRIYNWSDFSTRFLLGETVYYGSWSPNGQIWAGGLYQGNYKTAIGLWDAVSGSRLPDYTGHAGPDGYPPRLDFSADGSMVASSIFDVQLWRLSDHALLKQFTYNVGRDPVVAVSPDQALCASGVSAANAGAGKGVAIRTVDDGSIVQVLPTSDHVSGLNFTPDGQRLVVSHFIFSNVAPEVYKKVNGAWVFEQSLPTGSGWQAQVVYPNGYVALKPFSTGYELVFDPVSGTQVGLAPGYDTCSCADPFTQKALFGSAGDIKLVDPTQLGTVLQSWATGDVRRCLTASKDGKWFAGIPLNGSSVVLINRSTGAATTIATTARAFNTVRFSPDSKALMVTGYKGLWFYRVSDGALLKYYDQEVGNGLNFSGISSAEFINKGEQAVLGRWDGTVALIDTPLKVARKIGHR